MRTMLGLIGAVGVGLVVAVPPAGAADGAFGEAERLLATYFFWRGPWDDQAVTSGGQLGMSGTWKAIFPAPTDPRASLFGLDSADKWPGGAIPDTSGWPATYHHPDRLVPWLMAEWRAMKWSGIDFVLLDDWHSLVFNADLTPQPCFDLLARAWLELDRRGEQPLPFAMLLETPFAWYPGKDGDAPQASADGVAELWEPMRAFLRQFYGEPGYPARLPVRALARVMAGGEARPVVHHWFPTWVGAGLKKWDAWTFQELRRLCRATFGVEPYLGVNQHVYGPDCVGGWSSDQPAGGRVAITSEAGVVDYDVAWWGGMAGPQVYPKAIALGPGHWCPRQTGEKVVTPHYSPEYGADVYRYVQCWHKVLADPESFRRRLVIIESWNNNDEGCAISYSEPKDFRNAAGELLDRWGDRPDFYMGVTREMAGWWKKGECPERWRVAR
ncbi:MAG: hypothetical protein HYU66_00775 [Armatimonadetes bacterium]|nr:hypothetical protein [Armatimonadota bacterium]